MHRRRLMHAPDDRLEIIDVECPRIEVSIPPDDVERMVVENELVDAVILLHEQTEVAHLVVRAQLLRAPDVAFRIRRTFLELAELVPVALRPPDMAAAFHDEEFWSVAAQVERVPVQNPAMHDEVVPFVERELAEYRLEHALPLRHVHQLVGLRVAIE